TPKLKPGADLLGPLAHAGNSPVTFTPSTKYLLVDPLAIIADQHAQLFGSVLEFHFDRVGPGMAESVHQRFMSDMKDFIANDWLQRSGRSLDGHTVINSALAVQLIPDSGK